MPRMYVCPRHLALLRDLPDHDVHTIAAHRQPLHHRDVATGHAYGMHHE